MTTLFDELIQARSRGARVRALFDKQWGYVERAYVDYEDRGEHWRLEVEEFRSTTEAPDSEAEAAEKRQFKKADQP